MSPKVVHIRSESGDYQLVLALQQNRTKRQKQHEFFVESVACINALRGGAWTVSAFLYDPDRLSDWARDALEYTRAKVGGRAVTLRLETTSTRDRYRRLLAYVYVGDADHLNLDLVRDGQGYADRRFPHSLRSQFEQAESEARRRGRGLWKDVTEAQMPPWRRNWLKRGRGGGS